MFEIHRVQPNHIDFIAAVRCLKFQEQPHGLVMVYERVVHAVDCTLPQPTALNGQNARGSDRIAWGTWRGFQKQPASRM